jgi:hypothetical protein
MPPKAGKRGLKIRHKAVSNKAQKWVTSGVFKYVSKCKNDKPTPHKIYAKL